MAADPVVTGAFRWMSPAGELQGELAHGVLVRLRFVEAGMQLPLPAELQEDAEGQMPLAFSEAPAIRWWEDALAAYWAGRPMAWPPWTLLGGTAFERQVWQTLIDIPWGHVVAYGDVARAVGRPRAVRAVGRAVGANPLAIVVPCHRVVGASGSLTGYRGGLPRKEALLGVEGTWPLPLTRTRTSPGVSGSAW
jgi:O-6-methylguanine DNA methyltransferase